MPADVRKEMERTMSDKIDPAADRPQVLSDEDWKERVQRENADLDRWQAGSCQPESENQAGGPRGPAHWPQADFASLIGLLSTQALVALGVVQDPAAEKIESQPELARHFIDLLGVISEKTRGNLTRAESTNLEQILHQLRLAYMELAGKPGQSAGKIEQPKGPAGA